MAELRQTSRTTLCRFAEEGSYDVATIHAILDEGMVAHVAFVVDDQPRVVPVGYGRDGEKLFFHGSSRSGLFKALANGAEACVNVSIVDGLVLARAGIHHDVHFRSVTLFGSAREVSSDAGKLQALRAIVEHAIPGRWSDIRKPTTAELEKTTVLELEIREASAKVCHGDPYDDEADYSHPCWAGVIPLSIQAGAPADDPRLAKGIAAPDYVTHYRRARAAASRADS